MVDPKALHIPEQFESERLIIRAPRVRDAAELIAAIEESLEELRPWMPWATVVPELWQARQNMRRARRRYLAHQDFRLQIFLKGTETLIGCSGFHRIDWKVPRVEIGYWCRTPYCGRGYITEAVNAITDSVVEHVHARRVEIRMDDRNERSYRVAERCGFTYEGTLRCNELDIAGRIRDTRVYAKTFPG